MHQGRFETVALPLPARVFLLGQALYFLATGVWPLVSSRTFERVTGPKVDLWLVKTVGLLIGVVGLDLLLAVGRRRATAETALVAAGSAAALAAADVAFVARGRIPRIYLLDALAEVGVLAGWVWMGRYFEHK